MKPSASVFFQTLADAFLQGDHEWLADVYMYPLVVYVEGEIFLERTPSETLAALFDRRERALSAGTDRIASEVLEVGTEDGGRFPVRVDWTFLATSGRMIAKNELRYFCRYISDGTLKIEILEFISRGFEKDGGPTDPSVH